MARRRQSPLTLIGRMGKLVEAGATLCYNSSIHSCHAAIRDYCGALHYRVRLERIVFRLEAGGEIA